MTETSAESEESQRLEDEKNKRREEEEQAKLPYKWRQTLQDVDAVFHTIPKGTRGKELDIVIGKRHLKVGIKGQPPVVDVHNISAQLVS